MLFEFRLRPIDEIAPWGPEGKPSLHWLGLTDGFYRLKAGEEFLLHLSDEYVKHDTQKHPETSTCWMDYRVAQLWEDVLERLPHLLDPVPEKVLDFLTRDNFSFSSWEKTSLDWLESHGKVNSRSKEYEIYARACTWIAHRGLDLWYIRGDLRPEIWMWSREDTVTLNWDAHNVTDEGICVWSATSGHFSMPRQLFLDEVRRFNDKLISEMQQRVDEVSNGWNRSEIFINIGALQKDQLLRAESFQIALSKPAVSEWFTNWDDVIEAMRIIRGAL